MPAMVQKACHDLGAYAMKRGLGVEDSMKYASHFDDCDARVLPRDGWWRYHNAAIRCECACHYLHLTDEQTRKIKRAFIRNALLLYAVTAALPLTLYLIFA